MLKVDFISDSIKGINRKKNEDGLVIIDEIDFSLFVIFDGVGSAKNSLKAVEIATLFIKNNFNIFYKHGLIDLQSLMYSVNEKILKENIKEAFSTFVAVFINKNNGLINFSSLGDYRLYGVSKQYILPHSIDDKNIFSDGITKCLGMKDLKIINFKEKNLPVTQERLIICTDGFYSFIESDKSTFFSILNFINLNNIKKRLTKELFKNNSDDASYIIINYYV